MRGLVPVLGSGFMALYLWGCGGQTGGAAAFPDGADAAPEVADAASVDEAALRRKVERGGLGVARARRELAALLGARIPSDDLIDPTHEETVALLEEILSLEPSNQAKRRTLAKVLTARAEWARALVVIEGDADCAECLEMRADAYLQLGLQKMAAGDGPGAAVALERAHALEPNPVALISRAEVFAVHGAETADDALFALQRALAHEPFSPAVETRYLDTLTRVALRAATEGDKGGVEQALLLFPTRVHPRAQVVNELVLRATIGAAEISVGDFREARERHRVLMEDLLSFPEDSEIVRSFAERLETTLVAMATEASDQGQPEIAREILDSGLMLVPDVERLELYLLMLDSRGNPSDGLKKLAGMKIARSPEGTLARAELLAARAHRRIRDGKIKSAQKDVREAVKLHPDLTSVMLARAEVLAASRVPGLSYSSSRDALKRGLVTYPEGRVVRFAEALVEIRRARASMEQGQEAHALSRLLTPFIGDRIALLENDIRDYFPLEVSPSEDGRARVSLQHSGDTPLTVRVSLNRGRYTTVEVLPGTGAELEFEKGGVLRIDDGARPISVVAEPRTRIIASL